MVRVSKDLETLARSVARAVATGASDRESVRRYVVGDRSSTLLGVVDAADTMLTTALDVAKSRQWIDWDEAPNGSFVSRSLRVGAHVGEALGDG